MRVSPLAGTWYPADATELRAMLCAWQESLSGPVAERKTPTAVLVPHAGYVYSGEVAASIFAQLRPEAYDRVVILSPSHRCSLGMNLSLEPVGEVVTPLGSVYFDEATHALLSLPYVDYIPQAHKNEHAVDCMLPLIQHFLPHCVNSLGALVCGQWAWTASGKASLSKFATAFRKVLTPRTLIVISTDFTHYGKNFGYVPFTSAVKERLEVLDQQVYAACATNDGELLETLMQRTGATVCGRAPLSLLLAMVPAGTHWKQIAYTSSGAITGDFDHSVSYLAAMVFADWQRPLQERVQAVFDTANKDSEHVLDPVLQKQLLLLARQSLEYAAKHGKACSLESLLGSESLPKTLPAALLEKRAAFVTLQKDGHLRGCIGELLPTRSLAEAVVARACDAALKDSRFAPVSENELPSITLDISVLSVPVPVESYKSIEVGKHGIILQKDQRSSVFLPHVATEQGWDLATTLTHLSQKAGLHAKAWQEPDAVFFVFTSQHIEPL